MNLNFRGLDPKIASKIHAHRIEHGHDNLTQTLECIIKQWDGCQSCKYMDELLGGCVLGVPESFDMMTLR